ncbi:MAG: hydroxyacid dehydrogenase [Alphaproteobacteria bacterium]|nr:hydroxyacid dehydrogenase [Alphaproteobacteria bacterium]
MPHVVLAGKLHRAGIALLQKQAGFTFDHVEEVSEASYVPFMGKADALVIRTQPLRAATIAASNHLKIVSRHGVGYDAVDVTALTSHNIPLAIIGDVNSNAVAEHTMMMMLAAAHRLVRADASVRQGQWGWRNALEPQELFGKRLLIIGFGRIGRLLARIAQSFGMVVHAYDPYLVKQGWPDAGVAPEVDLGAALARADVVSVHIPKSDRPVLGAAELIQIKPGAIVINCARGGIVDEAALAVALKEGRVGAAALDVFDVEPPQVGHPLFGFDQVVMTPHNAALTRECGERMAVASVQNVLDFFAGKLDPALVVNGIELSKKGAVA